MEDLRRCTGCGQDKPPTDFYRTTSGRQAGQLSTRCKACTRARARYHQLTHPEQHTASLTRRNHARPSRIRDGVSWDDFQWLKGIQAGACALCERTEVRLEVDRAPETGELRGLLCAICTHHVDFIEQGRWIERARAYFAEAPGRTRRLLAERGTTAQPSKADE
jgi:hypothetical protein